MPARVPSCVSIGIVAAVLLVVPPLRPGNAAPLPVSTDVPRQPFLASVRRLVEALEIGGEPLPQDVRRRLEAAAALADDAALQNAAETTVPPPPDAMYDAIRDTGRRTLTGSRIDHSRRRDYDVITCRASLTLDHSPEPVS